MPLAEAGDDLAEQMDLADANAVEPGDEVGAVRDWGGGA
jgi:hypothetical protein